MIASIVFLLSLEWVFAREKRVNKIISVALSATLAFGVLTALPMSANAVVSTASEVSAEAIPKHELYKSYTYGGYKYRIVVRIKWNDSNKIESEPAGSVSANISRQVRFKRMVFEATIRVCLIKLLS